MADPSEFWDTQSKKCIVCARSVAYKVMCVSCKSLFHYSCTQRGSCCMFPRLVNEEGTEFPNVYLTTHGGPMMRSSMFMHPQQQQQLQQQQLQQQQLQQQQQHQLQQQQQQMVPQRSAAMYARQQGPMANMDAVQHNSPEWRQLIMAQQQQQQQQAGFGGAMRHNFQQGFNMSSNSMQMTAMQHQQLRVSRQEQMSQAQAMAAQGNPMAQMSSMNQAMMHMHQQQQQQQQQNLLQQQQSQHMSNLHMQQSQSMTIPSQQQQQQQPQQPAQSHPNQLMGATGGGPSNAMASYNPQTDFNFEFLDNLGTGDNPAFTDQDLLNSFDTDAGFNLDF